MKTRAHLPRALRERQPRREAGERKATDLLAEAAGLPNSGGAYLGFPKILAGGDVLCPHTSAVAESGALCVGRSQLPLETEPHGCFAHKCSAKNFL